jgi:hypothetical protein
MPKKLLNLIKKLIVNNKYLIFYLVISFALLYFYKYSYRQDLISYLSIADKYYNGNFEQAINGVWGPLLSWVLTLLRFLPIEPILGFKFVQILIGAITLIGINILFTIFDFQNYLKKCLTFSSIWIIYYYVFLTGTPDLLLACILLFLMILFLKWENGKIRFQIIAGVLGALLYFAKPYGFPAFLLLYVGFNIVSSRQRGKFADTNTIKSIFVGLLIFGILVSPWIYLLSSKYNKFTVSTGGNYNFAIVGPTYDGKHIPRIEKLYEPVNETATSYWEDPTFLDVKSWNPFGSFENFLHLFSNVYKNVFDLILFCAISSPFIFLLLFTINPKKVFKEMNTRILGLFALGYTSGLLLFFIRTRFLIAMQFILIVLTGSYLLLAVEKYVANDYLRKIIMIFVCLSLSFQPVYSILKNLNDGKEIYVLSEKLKNRLSIKGNLASVSTSPLGEDWRNSLTLSYLLNVHYFGEVDRKLDVISLYNELIESEIDYYFVWDNEQKINSDKFQLVFHESVKYLHTILKRDSSKELMVYLMK